MGSPLTRQGQVAEILKCGKNPSYFINNYAKIQHPVQGLIPFDTYDFQDDCLKSFEEHRFSIVLKSRQLGLSTVTAAYALWMALFKKDKNILVIATKLPTAMNFIKKVKTMLDSLPPWLLLTKFEPTKQSIKFTNGSTITAIPTSPDAGRSEALALLIIDEAAWIRDFDEIWTGLYPTLSTGGSAILLSTPNGVGGQYYKLWVGAEAGVNNFHPIKLPWWVHPDHDQEWFDKESRSLPKRKIAQEFNCDFISSGDTFLQPSELEKVYDSIRQPLEKTGPQNGIWTWQKPIPGQKYIISADVSRGDASDFSAFHVIDYDTKEVAVEFMGKTPPDKLADLLAEYGHLYNDALICPEQNTFGYFTCVKLRDMKYPTLYYPNSNGDMFAYRPIDPETTPGFITSQKSRNQVLTKLEELIRNDILKTRSQRLYDQLQAFVWHGSKAAASKDSHDDLIMSIAIGSWLVSDDVGSSEQSMAMAMAMLKATFKSSNSIDTLPGGMNDVKPVQKHQITNYDSSQVARPRDASQIKNADVSDFSWLYK